jgi:hypothetical protein
MTKPTEHDLEQLLERLTKPTYVWRMARALVHPPQWHDPEHALSRSAQTRRRNALAEVREVLEQQGWRYEGADHHDPTEELL